MKIEKIETTAVELKLRTPIVNASRIKVDSVGCVLVRLRTDAGIDGESLLFSLRSQYLPPLQAMVDALGKTIVGENPAYPERIWEKLWREMYFFGFAGISVFAISALDTALWDAHAKSLNLPLATLLGGFRAEVPAYASQGLWVGATTDELIEEAAGFKAGGFKAMKMRLGLGMDEDVRRVKAVREAVGYDVSLMADCSRGFTVDHAIRLGRKLEEFRLTWLEEPVPAQDIAGIAEVAAALDTPVAIGESDYTSYGFRRILEARAAGIWMMDLQRVGGISEMKKVAALARAHDIPVSNHIFTEHSLAVLSTISNCNVIEYVDWFEELYEQRVEMANGCLRVPERPGVGFTFDWKRIERMKVN